jgi:hypothetical protein
MIHLIKYLLFVTVVSFSGVVYAQNWIPYQNNPPQLVQQTVTQQSYVQQSQPVVYYQYVPYVVNQPTVIEERCWFHRTHKVVYVPQLQYFYQPVLIYR